MDGHGNFGSIEGDGAAAMRYTEARLQKIAQDAYLSDLDKDTVDYVPNFDETEKEPSVLPVKIPNLLINGAEGIAVGMTTNIPPHNLTEVIEALKAYLKNPDISTEKLMDIVKGPDFPTGGIVTNKKDLLEIYESGQGKIKVRGRAKIEKLKGGKERIVISEIPYTMIGTGIGKFLNDTYQLVEDKKAPEIVDISNQSSKDGIRIVIDLKKGADAQNILNLLYKKTRLEDTFGMNLLAIANGRPETLGLKDVLRHCANFQYEIEGRKYKNLLEKELGKKEVEEGLIKATDVIDLIIEILRGSKTKEDAKSCLVNGDTSKISFKTKKSQKEASGLSFTDRQAEAILNMRLYRLIGLEIDALMKEHEKTLANIARYEDILNNFDSMTKLIIKELNAFSKEYGRERKTLIEDAEEIVVKEKKLEEKEVIFLMDRFGYGKTVDVSAYERNKEAIDGEFKYITPCMNTGRICIFTTLGMLHTIKVTDLPHGRYKDKGVPLDNVCNYDSSKGDILYLSSLMNLKEKKLVFVSSGGMTKITDASEFIVQKRSVVATKLNEGEELTIVGEALPGRSVVYQTERGQFLRVGLDEIPEKKKNAVGVRGIKLSPQDAIENIYLIDPTDDMTVKYKDKKIVLNRLHFGRRDTKGTKK